VRPPLPPLAALAQELTRVPRPAAKSHATDILPVFITCDPARDDVKAVKSYVKGASLSSLCPFGQDGRSLRSTFSTWGPRIDSLTCSHHARRLPPLARRPHRYVRRHQEDVQGLVRRAFLCSPPAAARPPLAAPRSFADSSRLALLAFLFLIPHPTSTRRSRVYFSTPPDASPSDDYLVDHSIFFYLMDPRGKFVDAFGRSMGAPDVVTKVGAYLDEWKEGKGSGSWSEGAPTA